VAVGSRSEPVVSAIRLREEVAFATAINADLHLLDLPDASLRGYDDATERGTILVVDDLMPSTLALRLREIIERLRPSVYWCPLGLGCHVDHVLTRNALFALARAGTLAVFYEDLPYATELEEDAVLSFVRALPVEMEPVPIDISDVWQAKLSFLLCYPSQVGPGDRAGIEQVATRRAEFPGSKAERLWIVRWADNGPSFLAIS
jgi:LmbE family N-acetylglucosaminyl deacetylase